MLPPPNYSKTIGRAQRPAPTSSQVGKNTYFSLFICLRCDDPAHPTTIPLVTFNITGRCGHRPLHLPSLIEGGGKTAGFDGGSEQHINSHRLAPASTNIKNLLSLIVLNSIIKSDRTLPSDNKPQFLYILCRRRIL